MFFTFVVARCFDKLIWIEDCATIRWRCSTQLKFPLWLSHHCLVTVEHHLTFAKCHFHLLCTSLMPAFQKRHKFGSDRSFRIKSTLGFFSSDYRDQMNVKYSAKYCTVSLSILYRIQHYSKSQRLPNSECTFDFLLLIIVLMLLRTLDIRYRISSNLCLLALILVDAWKRAVHCHIVWLPPCLFTTNCNCNFTETS